MTGSEIFYINKKTIYDHSSQIIHTDNKLKSKQIKLSESDSWAEVVCYCLKLCCHG